MKLSMLQFASTWARCRPLSFGSSLPRRSTLGLEFALGSRGPNSRVGAKMRAVYDARECGRLFMMTTRDLLAIAIIACTGVAAGCSSSGPAETTGFVAGPLVTVMSQSGQLKIDVRTSPHTGRRDPRDRVGAVLGEPQVAIGSDDDVVGDRVRDADGVLGDRSRGGHAADPVRGGLREPEGAVRPLGNPQGAARSAGRDAGGEHGNGPRRRARRRGDEEHRCEHGTREKQNPNLEAMTRSQSHDYRSSEAVSSGRVGV